MTNFVPEGEAVGDGVEAPLGAETDKLNDLDSPVEQAEPTPGQTTGETTAQQAEPDYAALLAERTEDLQRLQAEYVNYKRRVDRDREVARAHGIEAVIVDLLPVLDSVMAAAEHDELVGGFKVVANELEKVSKKYEVVSYGAQGDPFDPHIHDALMMVPAEPGSIEPTVGQLLQTGYKVKDRIIRHARVAVAEPVDLTPAEPENS